MSRLKEFTTEFDALCRRQNKGRAFSDFAEIAACTVHQIPYHARIVPRDAEFERVEQAYLATVGKYERDEVEQIVKLFGIATQGVIEGQNDFLGHVYMALEISNDKSGQFFTPSSLQRMMALMSLSDAGSIIRERGVVTISDPAAGAGGMLIEAANVIRQQGHDPQRTMWFQAIDIDRTCFNMSYFQLSTLGLQGEVVHGNTLSMQLWETRVTPQSRMLEPLRAMSRVSRQVERPEPTLTQHRSRIVELLRSRSAMTDSTGKRPLGKQLELNLDR